MKEKILTEIPNSPCVLLVGAGRRIQNNFLPALRTLVDDFTVCGIHSRTAATLQPVADRWGVPAVHSLTGPEVESADVVAISVPTSQNAPVLRALLPVAQKITIVIDTPITGNRRDLAAIGPLLKRFRRVVVTEDYMNFPAFALVREAVAQGLIGKPRAITLNNIGYTYHGMALIRSFNGFQPAIRTWRRKLDAKTTIVGYKFKGDYSACVIGPYRRETSAGLTLEGTQGVITQYAEDLAQSSQSRPVYLLAPCYSDGHVIGYRIEAGDRSLEVFPSELPAMREMPFADKSDLNLQRGCGLATVFRSLLDRDDAATRLNRAYGPENAFYDNHVSRLAARGFLPVDPLTFFGGDFMSVFQKLSRLRA